MAARTGRGNTPRRSIRIHGDLWDPALAIANEAGETEGLSGPVKRFLEAYVRSGGEVRLVVPRSSTRATP